MDLTTATDWARTRRSAVLITLRSDGRAQTSDVMYAVEGDTFVVSVTDGRAKTTNIRRDPRIVLHVSEPASWSYLSLDGVAELTAVTTEAGDATSDALCAYYEAVTGGPHDDWDAYRAAMVEEGRLLVRLLPSSAVGQIS